MNHPECTILTYREYQEIKDTLLSDAKKLCKQNGYWCVCVAIKTVRNEYLVNESTGYLFTADSEENYIHKLMDWNFDGALVITVYLHDITASTFTKYPKNYVKASFSANPYMKDLVDYLDYLSDDEIDELEVDTYAEPCAWMIIPEHLRDTVEKAVGLDYCSPNETYYYYIEYHPDDDSIYFGIDTDLNIETLWGVSKQTEDRFKDKFKTELGV